MVHFIVNNQKIETDSQKNLLDFLRDDLRLTSVKEGCSTGACGTCSVLIGGISKRACTQKVQKLDGVEILTVDGLTPREKQVYAYCFGIAGAVQCGFCIPGMVISAKSLLDKNLSPTEAEIRKAIKGNICRCTGYVKIVEAIALAAEYLRENIPVPTPVDTALLGDEIIRPDATDKTLGTAPYVDDIALPCMVYASAVRTPYPRATVLKIDTSAALAHPDCVTVITAKDVPVNKTGHLKKDWDVLIAEGDNTRYVGDGVALVVSKTKENLEAIKDLVKVDYKPLEALSSPALALAEGAPELHEGGNILSVQHLKRGEDVDAIFEKSAHVITQHYSTPFTDHAFMEPECAIGEPDGENIKLYTASQNIYDERREIAHILDIDPERLHIESQTVGGGFGGKEDMSVQHHAALATFITGLPVKVRLSRQESILVHPKRHAMEINMTTACDENGIISAVKADIISDTGAYASLGGPVLQRACTHAGGPYNYANVDIKGTAVYTNNPPAGAFRGFGVTQSVFAIESNLTLLAEKVGISPLEIRLRNAIRPGQSLPNGQIADVSTALYECLEALKPYYDETKTMGLACALKNSGLGVGVPDTGRCIVSVENEKIHVRTGAARIGQGLDAVILKIACQTLDVKPSQVIIEQPNTQRTPNSGTTTASRQTLFTGEAVRVACENLLAKKQDQSWSDINGQEAYGEYTCVTDPIDSQKDHPISHAAYGYGAQLVVLDDDGKVADVICAYDVGKVINRTGAEGQVEGGVAMGLGYALTEDYPLIDSIPQVTYAKLRLFRADQTPTIKVLLVESDDKLAMAYGAKGVGELATIPTAPAVSAAYYKKDGLFRSKLPILNTPYSK
ncbi:MAG: selenium-dependent xanthine dehydrogenase [Eubacteriales bacterium]